MAENPDMAGNELEWANTSQRGRKGLDWPTQSRIVQRRVCTRQKKVEMARKGNQIGLKRAKLGRKGLT